MSTDSATTSVPPVTNKQQADQYIQQKRMHMARIMSEYVSNLTSSRMEMARKLMDPRRDLNTECGYPETITLEEYQQMFDREGIGTRVVGVWPEETWTQDPSIKDNEEADDTEFEKRWKALEKGHNLFHYMHRVDELSGIGAFGVALIGLDDGLTLDKPITGITLNGPDTGKKTGEPVERRMTFCRVFGQSSVSIDSVVDDVTSPRHGLPEYYMINLATSKNYASTDPAPTTIQGDPTKVHWTRVIHVADNRKSSEVFGVPRQQTVWNRLLDIRKLAGGSAEMFWKGAFPGISFETHPELAGMQVDVESMREEFAEFANGLNRFMATSGFTANALAPVVADPEPHIMIQIRLIAMSIRVPWRVLLGSEAAQLASDQDRQNFDKRIQNRRTKYVTPWIIRPFVDRLILLGVLPEPETDEEDIVAEYGHFAYDVDWPELQEAKPKDKAEVAKVIIETVARYIQSGANLLIPEKTFLMKFLDMDEDEADAILDEVEDLISSMDDEDEDDELDGDPIQKGRPNPQPQGRAGGGGQQSSGNPGASR